MSAVQQRIAPVVMGMVLFIASEVMFFGGLFAAYFSIRAEQTTWPPPGTPPLGLALPAIGTAVLIASSGTQHRAAGATHRGDPARARRWMGLTIALGVLFITGQAWEWSALRAEGLTIASSVYGTLFYTLTGAHGLHVLGGLALLAVTVARLGPGSRSRARIEAVTYYWHFVDVVWLGLFTALYVPL
jgi:cytochrome c oxidase subunit 3